MLTCLIVHIIAYPVSPIARALPYRYTSTSLLDKPYFLWLPFQYKLFAAWTSMIFSAISSFSSILWNGISLSSHFIKHWIEHGNCGTPCGVAIYLENLLFFLWTSASEIFWTKRLETYSLNAARYAPSMTDAASSTVVLPEAFFPINTFIPGFRRNVWFSNFL